MFRYVMYLHHIINRFCLTIVMGPPLLKLQNVYKLDLRMIMCLKSVVGLQEGHPNQVHVDIKLNQSWKAMVQPNHDLKRASSEFSSMIP